MRPCHTGMTVALALLLALPARAQEDEEAEAEELPPPSFMTITMAPLRLFNDVIEATVEWGPGGALSVAGTAGVGWSKRALFELGAQGRFSVWGAGSDKSVFLGAEVLFVASDVVNYTWLQAGTNLTSTAFVGAKVVRFGLTVDSRVGLHLMLAGPDAFGLGILCNVGVGYTF